jgi:hypothetical protein
MDRDIPEYRIHYLLRSYTEKIKHKHINTEVENTGLDTFLNDQLLSSDGKKHQLIDQFICEAITHFTTRMCGKNEPKIAGDILRDLSSEHGRRKPYGTLIQDSRRR